MRIHYKTVKTVKNTKMYLSSYNSISTIEVFTVHMHGASFALRNTSSSTCTLKKKIVKRTTKHWSTKATPIISFKWSRIEKSHYCRLTCEFSHDLLYSSSSRISVAMGTICSDQVVGQINCCFDTNCTGFLTGEGKNYISNFHLNIRLSGVYSETELILPFLVCNSEKWNYSTLNLAIIQVAESSDDLLLIELICLQFHTPHGLHGAIILQTLITSHHHLCGWGFIQFVYISFL